MLRVVEPQSAQGPNPASPSGSIMIFDIVFKCS
jgi:hypothetical protein